MVVVGVKHVHFPILCFRYLISARVGVVGSPFCFRVNFRSLAGGVHGAWLVFMERDYELVSGTPTAVVHNESGEGESRDAYLRLMEAGLDADSEQGASQYSPEQSLASERGRANIHGFEAFENFNFQKCSQTCCIGSYWSGSLPDLPWETAAWSFIFNDDHNMLLFVDPAGSFADPPMPALPGGADEVLGELVERKKRSRTNRSC